MMVRSAVGWGEFPSGGAVIGVQSSTSVVITDANDRP